MTRRSSTLVICALLLLSIVAAQDQCAPAAWTKGSITRRQTFANSTFLNGTQPENSTSIKPGQINCRYFSKTRDTVDDHTCFNLATRYQITVATFFGLNPSLNQSCGNIRPNTQYCVAGFVEPVRATDGLCGPMNNNATCLGTGSPCCNADSWTCGNTDADCAPGTCYEGACPGDKVYSTDGTCGAAHGYRLCAGVWGDCCNSDGRCGSGEDFCAIDVCQSGNCSRPVVQPSDPPWAGGNTTDGTYGDENQFSCNVVYGRCCNKDNVCGSLDSDCGVGCQSRWGECSSISTASSSTKTSTETCGSSETVMPYPTETIVPSYGGGGHGDGGYGGGSHRGEGDGPKVYGPGGYYNK